MTAPLRALLPGDKKRSKKGLSLLGLRQVSKSSPLTEEARAALLADLPIELEEVCMLVRVSMTLTIMKMGTREACKDGHCLI